MSLLRSASIPLYLITLITLVCHQWTPIETASGRGRPGNEPIRELSPQELERVERRLAAIRISKSFACGSGSDFDGDDRQNGGAELVWSFDEHPQNFRTRPIQDRGRNRTARQTENDEEDCKSLKLLEVLCSPRPILYPMGRAFNACRRRTLTKEVRRLFDRCSRTVYSGPYSLRLRRHWCDDEDERFNACLDRDTATGRGRNLATEQRRLAECQFKALGIH